MSGLHSKIRGRTFLAGKIIFNFGQSSIDCTVRRLSDDGATLELESGLGVPERFLLTVAAASGVRWPPAILANITRQTLIGIEVLAFILPPSISVH